MCGIKLIVFGFLLIYVPYLNSYEIITKKHELQSLENLIITKQERFIFIDYEEYFSLQEQILIESKDRKKIKEKLTYFANLNKSLKKLSKKDYKIFIFTIKPKTFDNMQENLHSIGICLHSYHFPVGVTCESSNSYVFIEPYANSKTLLSDNNTGFMDFVIYGNNNKRDLVISNFLQSCSLSFDIIKSSDSETNKPTLRKRNSSLNVSGNNY